MITLVDGPASGVFRARRAPMYLRAVVRGDNGKTDVLDQLGDIPDAGETVSVYRLVKGPETMFVCGKGPGMGPSLLADYRHLADVDGGLLRSKGDWREWVRTQVDMPIDMETGEIRWAEIRDS